MEGGVVNDERERLWRYFRNSRGQVLDDRGVGVEQIITRHSWLTRNTGGNDNHVHTLQRILQLVISLVTSHLLPLIISSSPPPYRSLGVHVRQVSGHSRRVDNVKQAQVRNQFVLFQQQRHGLPNSTGGSHNGHLESILEGNESQRQRFQTNSLGCKCATRNERQHNCFGRKFFRSEETRSQGLS